MPTPTKGPRLGSGPAHEKLMLANMATALFEHGKITTTVAKAKRLRPLAERLITFAKKGDLAARRRAMTIVRDKSVVHSLFTEIGPQYAGRPGGYTRITKIGPRKGDNAPMAVIELVEPMLEQVVAEASAATKRAAKGSQGAQSATDTTIDVPEFDDANEGMEVEAMEEVSPDVEANDGVDTDGSDDAEAASAMQPEDSDDKQED